MKTVPPKTVFCSICHEEVLKCRTLARADGTRACREHPGIEEESKRLQEQERLRKGLAATEKERQQLEQARALPKELLRSSRHITEFRNYVDHHCWTCGAEGITLQEYFANCMVAQKRLELRGEFNLFTMHEEIAKLLGNPTVLAMLPYDDQKDGKLYRDVTDRRLKDILHFIKVINMCTHCIARHDVYDRLEALLPKPTMEQLEALSPVVAILDPVLEAMALRKEQEN